MLDVGCWMLDVFLLCVFCFSSRAQLITNTFGPSRIVIAPGATLQLQGDPGNQPITAAPSVMGVPMEDNVAPFAASQFSPNMVRVGERAIYRLIVNCAAGEVEVPDTIVTASGLTLNHGAASQEMVYLNNRVRRIL